MKYRKLDTRIWGDERFRAFSDTGKLAFLFVLTHPALTALGAMRGTLGGLAAELGWPVRRLRAALKPAVAQGMIELNEGAAYIALPKFLRYNPAENPNVARAWVTALDLVPECAEKQALIARCRESLTGTRRQGFEEAFAEAFGQPFPQPLPNGMPNPEPEPEPEPFAGTGTRAGERDSPPTPSHSREDSSRNSTSRPSRKHVNALWRQGDGA